MNSTDPPNAPPKADESVYGYSHPELNESHDYLLPGLTGLLAKVVGKDDPLFEVGSGNGSVANVLSQRGYSVIGVEPSGEGVANANKAYPHLKIAEGSGYDDLAAQYGTYKVVFSLEVIEHVYAPRVFAKCCFDLVEPGGHLILSTPYHGYLKNLALALTGKFDSHFTALWDHGHIKFWSVQTLSELLEEAGFDIVETVRVGRIPPLAKSMFLLARKPGA